MSTPESAPARGPYSPAKKKGVSCISRTMSNTEKMPAGKEDTPEMPLERKRDFISAVLGTVEALVLVLDKTGRIVRFNRACEKATGYSFAEVKGNFVWDMLIHPEEAEEVKRTFANLAAGLFAGHHESYWIAKNRRRLLISWSNTALLDADGNVEFVVLTGIDLTEQRRIQQEKENLRAELVHSQKLESVGRLADGIAHDFNNLLSAIIGYSEILLESLPSDSPVAPAVRTIRLAGEKAAVLTKQLLTFSRRQALEMRPVNIKHVIEDMFKMLRRMIGEDIIMVLHTEKPVRNIVADRGQIEQVLLTLAANARDAMPRGGQLSIETGDVELGRAAGVMPPGLNPGNYVALTVSDTGEGMEKAVAERIFEPSYTTKAKGSGVGLSTVYGIVKQHEGAITIASEPGKGTVFTIYFPAYEGAAAEELAEETEEVRGGSETILVVDDDVSLRKLLADSLGPLGYRILTASGGEEAIQLFQPETGKVDLLLTDLVMPGMDGRELANSLKERDPLLKVIFMSGYADNLLPAGSEIEKGQFLRKPLSLRKLAQKVREALDR